MYGNSKVSIGPLYIFIIVFVVILPIVLYVVSFTYGFSFTWYGFSMLFLSHKDIW